MSYDTLTARCGGCGTSGEKRVCQYLKGSPEAEAWVGELVAVAGSDATVDDLEEHGLCVSANPAQEATVRDWLRAHPAPEPLKNVITLVLRGKLVIDVGVHARRLQRVA